MGLSVSTDVAAPPHKDAEGHSAAPPSQAPKQRAGAGGEQLSGNLPRGVGTHCSELLMEYKLGNVLGQGAFGVVYSCARKSDSVYDYAVKMVDKVETPVNEIKREADTLKLLEHPNVVKFVDIYYEKFFVCIVMIRYSGGDMIEGMQRHWKERGQIPCTEVVAVKRQMVFAISHLHSKCVVHRDVKGDNFLLDRKNLLEPGCKVILSDFGTACMIKPDQRLSKTSVGTKLYWAPEFYAGNYSFKVDLWALGVIVYGLLDGRFPFKTEADVNRKAIKLPEYIPEKCKAFVFGLLDRRESNRFSGEEALKHPWILPADGGALPATRPPKSKQDTPSARPFLPEQMEMQMREQGANVGIAARRKELVERLENKGQKTKRETTGFPTLDVFWKVRFAVHDKHTDRELRYEWWSPAKVERKKILDFPGAKDASYESKESVETIRKMLVEHNIDISEWGKGNARTLEDFAAEIQSGSATLMLDASEHKKLVRVTDVVVLRITRRDASGVDTFLVESAEQLADGRRRTGLNRLPGSKKEPHENTKGVVNRMLRDMLAFKDDEVSMDFARKEVFEEEGVSPSYPGLKTIYRKELVEGRVATKQAAGCRRLASVSELEGQLTKECVWYTEVECQEHGVQLRATREDDAMSGLVQAPIGMSEEELQAYLDTGGVDIGQFGQNGSKSLKEFSTELIKGESSLMINPDGGLIRIVDLVLLTLRKEGVGDLLVELQEKQPDGKINVLNRLPGTKRRPDENHFVTARRCLRKQLKMDENYVNIFKDDVKITEEEKYSPSYPGIRTVYRKRIIAAELRR